MRKELACNLHEHGVIQDSNLVAICRDHALWGTGREKRVQTMTVADPVRCVSLRHAWEQACRLLSVTRRTLTLVLSRSAARNVLCMYGTPYDAGFVSQAFSQHLEHGEDLHRFSGENPGCE